MWLWGLFGGNCGSGVKQNKDTLHIESCGIKKSWGKSGSSYVLIFKHFTWTQLDCETKKIYTRICLFSIRAIFTLHNLSGVHLVLLGSHFFHLYSHFIWILCILFFSSMTLSPIFAPTNLVILLKLRSNCGTFTTNIQRFSFTSYTTCIWLRALMVAITNVNVAKVNKHRKTRERPADENYYLRTLNKS